MRPAPGKPARRWPQKGSGDMNRPDAVALLAVLDPEKRLPRLAPKNAWPILKVLQHLSPEINRYQGSIYQPGDLLLPYWTVRSPGILKIAVVGVAAEYQKYRTREVGGGFLGSFDQKPVAEAETEVVTCGRLYAVSEYHGPLVIPFFGARISSPLTGFGTTFQSFVKELMSLPEIYEEEFVVRSTRVEYRDNSFWTFCAERNGISGEALRSQARNL